MMIYKGRHYSHASVSTGARDDPPSEIMCSVWEVPHVTITRERSCSNNPLHRLATLRCEIS
jgi:hypothetical protein